MEGMGWERRQRQEETVQGEKRRLRGGEVKKKAHLVGGSFLIFLPLSVLWVCIMWWRVICLWSHQSCANRLAGKHVSLRACGGECVCCVNYRCGIVWEMVWWSKTYINGEQVGQLTLSQTNLFSWARGKRLELESFGAVPHAFWIQAYSSMDRFSMLHLHSLN